MVSVNALSPLSQRSTAAVGAFRHGNNRTLATACAVWVLAMLGDPAGSDPETASQQGEREEEGSEAPALQPTPPAVPRQPRGEAAGGDAESGKLAQESPADAVAASSEEQAPAAEDLGDTWQHNKALKKVALLRNVPFCKDLPDDTLLTLAKKMKRVTVRAHRL